MRGEDDDEKEKVVEMVEAECVETKIASESK